MAKINSLGIQKQSKSDLSGDRIRAARLTKEMTQKELAAKIGITDVSIILIEGNKTKASLPTLRTMSKSLDVPISYLGKFENLPENTHGKKIKKARHFRGLNRTEAAMVLGVDVKTLWGWESDTHKPLDQYKEKIIDFLSVLH